MAMIRMGKENEKKEMNKEKRRNRKLPCLAI
jgi:hypothetical protein